jgi:hypothetical protein
VANEVSVDLVLKPTSDKAAFSKVESESKKAGESAGDSFGGGFKSGVASVAKVAAVAAAAAGAAIAFGFKKGIDAAIVQEDAVNRLNTALQITGKFSQQASEDLQKFASQLQTTTKFGDEAILSSAGLIQQLANLDTQGLKRATKASTELASALKIDLESASTLVAKAIEGNTASLGRYGIKIKASANETENLANVLGAIEGKFGGTAAAQINTYSGAIAQSGNAFGDLLEKVGDFVIKSPVVISLIKDTTKFFAESADAVEKFRLNFNLIEDLINPLARFNEGVITYVIAPLELVTNYLTASFKFWTASLSGLVAGIGFAGQKLADFLNVLGVDNDMTKGLQQFGETSKQVFNEAADQAGKSFKSILDFPFSEGLATKNEELRQKLAERNQIAVEKNQELNTTVADGAKGLGFIFSSIIDQNSFFTDKTAKQTTRSLEETNKATTEFAKKSGQAIQQGIGVAAGNAFAAFGKALAEGDNAMGAFADAFIQSIGQIAVQQGTAFILQGLAYSFIPGPSQAMAGGLIAAGAALATFGGALSALSGGGKKSAVGGGGIGMSADTQVFSSPQETLSQPDDIAQRSESGPRVQLIVQGDIFNTEDTGNRLIDILNSNFENKGNSFNNARFA